MKRIVLACALLLALPGCITAGVVIAGLGTAAIVAQDTLSSYCANSTNAEHNAAAGCELVEGE
jgi:hypothetical protein